MKVRYLLLIPFLPIILVVGMCCMVYVCAKWNKTPVPPKGHGDPQS